MSISPYKLNMLYANGIIDSVPLDLATPMPIGYMQGMQNPYLSQAMSGFGFQNYGLQADSFNSTGNNIAYDNSTIGVKSTISRTMYGIDGVGTKAANDIYGFKGIGEKAKNREMNAWGISGNTQQNINSAISNIQSSPLLKPLLGVGLILTAVFSVKHMFRGGAKKVVKPENKGFFQKINIFKKKK